MMPRFVAPCLIVRDPHESLTSLLFTSSPMSAPSTSSSPTISARDGCLLAAGMAVGGAIACYLTSLAPAAGEKKRAAAQARDLLAGPAAAAQGGGKKLTLEYFNIVGVAERVRLALALNGVPFDDVRVAFADWKERKKTARYGQLPCMTLPDGREVYQSDAMLRTAGAAGDAALYPADPDARLRVDELLGLVGDMKRSWYPCIAIALRPTEYGYPQQLDGDMKATLLRALRETWIREKLPVYMGFFADHIEKNGGRFLAGDSLTIADLSAAPDILYFTKGIADYVPKDCLDKFPKIKAYLDAFYAEPRIKAYYDGLEK